MHGLPPGVTRVAKRGSQKEGRRSFLKKRTKKLLLMGFAAVTTTVSHG
jgi:hypothetical protein